MFIEPVDLREIDKKAANIYEAAIIASKRARQINDDYKIEYNALVSTIPTAAGDEEGEEFDNPAQLKIALDFEKREKPHVQALHELLDGEIKYDYKNKPAEE
jgi:DNA-directed RNA polymerase subunit K/omega